MAYRSACDRHPAAALASNIGMMDLTKAAQTVSQRETRPSETYLFLAMVC
jgi:ABC-type amino acid transport system permease subunit